MQHLRNDILVTTLEVLNLKCTKNLLDSTKIKYKMQNLQNIIQITGSFIML